jgi:hypothetical protein
MGAGGKIPRRPGMRIRVEGMRGEADRTAMGRSRFTRPER